MHVWVGVQPPARLVGANGESWVLRTISAGVEKVVGAYAYEVSRVDVANRHERAGLNLAKWSHLIGGAL